jgi:hypothetical protein
MELIPSFRFERRNLQASLSLPLELNLQDFSLLVDPSAFDLFVPELYSEKPFCPLPPAQRHRRQDSAGCHAKSPAGPGG